MNIASKMNGTDTIAVMMVSVLSEVGSIGYPKAGKNGIGKPITIHIPIRKISIFHLLFNLEYIGPIHLISL
jgi:hypothetical protein